MVCCCFVCYIECHVNIQIYSTFAFCHTNECLRVANAQSCCIQVNTFLQVLCTFQAQIDVNAFLQCQTIQCISCAAVCSCAVFCCQCLSADFIAALIYNCCQVVITVGNQCYCEADVCIEYIIIIVTVIVVCMVSFFTDHDLRAQDIACIQDICGCISGSCFIDQDIIQSLNIFVALCRVSGPVILVLCYIIRIYQRTIAVVAVFPHSRLCCCQCLTFCQCIPISIAGIFQQFFHCIQAACAGSCTPETIQSDGTDMVFRILTLVVVFVFDIRDFIQSTFFRTCCHICAVTVEFIAVSIFQNVDVNICVIAVLAIDTVITAYQMTYIMEQFAVDLFVIDLIVRVTQFVCCQICQQSFCIDIQCLQVISAVYFTNCYLTHGSCSLTGCGFDPFAVYSFAFCDVSCSCCCCDIFCLCCCCFQRFCCCNSYSLCAPDGLAAPCDLNAGCICFHEAYIVTNYIAIIVCDIFNDSFCCFACFISVFAVSGSVRQVDGFHGLGCCSRCFACFYSRVDGIHIVCCCFSYNCSCCSSCCFVTNYSTVFICNIFYICFYIFCCCLCTDLVAVIISYILNLRFALHFAVLRSVICQQFFVQSIFIHFRRACACAAGCQCDGDVAGITGIDRFGCFCCVNRTVIIEVTLCIFQSFFFAFDIVIVFQIISVFDVFICHSFSCCCVFAAAAAAAFFHNAVLMVCYCCVGAGFAAFCFCCHISCCAFCKLRSFAAIHITCFCIAFCGFVFFGSFAAVCRLVAFRSFAAFCRLVTFGSFAAVCRCFAFGTFIIIFRFCLCRLCCCFFIFCFRVNCCRCAASVVIFCCCVCCSCFCSFGCCAVCCCGFCFCFCHRSTGFICGFRFCFLCFRTIIGSCYCNSNCRRIAGCIFAARFLRCATIPICGCGLFCKCSYRCHADSHRCCHCHCKHSLRFCSCCCSFFHKSHSLYYVRVRNMWWLGWLGFRFSPLALRPGVSLRFAVSIISTLSFF